jgi:hypothetical protein
MLNFCFFIKTNSKKNTRGIDSKRCFFFLKYALFHFILSNGIRKKRFMHMFIVIYNQSPTTSSNEHHQLTGKHVKDMINNNLIFRLIMSNNQTEEYPLSARSEIIYVNHQEC